MATERGFVFADGALDAASRILERQRHDEHDFANARTLRNLLERAIQRQAARLVGLGILKPFRRVRCTQYMPMILSPNAVGGSLEEPLDNGPISLVRFFLF